MSMNIEAHKTQITVGFLRRILEVYKDEMPITFNTVCLEPGHDTNICHCFLAGRYEENRMVGLVFDLCEKME